ncbi:MAG: hypothetical protein QW829_01935 [Candidatus Bathyarchaeia archaeon]
MPRICEVVAEMENFKKLVEATKAAGLIPVLNSGGPYTLSLRTCLSSLKS